MVIVCASTVDVVAQDVLTFENGDQLSGRIKRLERGELVLDLPIAEDDVTVDWARVSVVESQRVFQFQTRDGVRFLGRIRQETDPEAGTLVVEFGGVTETYERDDIVLVVETVGEIRGLLEILMSGGLSLTKANDQKQMNAEASVKYETPAFTVSASVNSLFTTQRDGVDTNRHDVALLFSRNVGNR